MTNTPDIRELIIIENEMGHESGIFGEENACTAFVLGGENGRINATVYVKANKEV